MQIRLSLSHLAVVLVSVVLAAVLAWLAVERLYLDTQKENLLAQARLTAAALQGVSLPIEEAAPYVQTANLQPGIHTRLLDEQAAVAVSLPLIAGGTPVQVPPAENSGSVSPADLLGRSEIKQAMQGRPATAVRRVQAAGNRRVLYAAAPILTDKGTVAGIVYIATPLPVGGLPPEVILQLAGGLLAAVLLAGAAGALLARRISRPLEQVARAAGAVTAGDLDQEVPAESGIAELQDLGRAFNDMTAGLRRADQAKNAFLADVTHELRTPLTVIKGTIETLEDGALDDREGRGPLLASMQGETERLIRLVNELLVLTRADAGALKLDMRPLDLGGLARSRCEKLALLAARRHVELQVQDQEPDSGRRNLALGDADRVAQVLDNLLDNAIRYAPEGSTVDVTVRQTGREVECAVSDRGPGIPPEHLPFIFERFYRADASRDRHTGGTGLGLAITRALVVAQGGRISVRSAEGEGATFIFRLRSAETATHLPEN